ncbi:MAG TPA: FAD-dependent tricarballylate dehydrogenase TcuA [Candidatus Dormibacteraeota bacterium]
MTSLHPRLARYQVVDVAVAGGGNAALVAALEARSAGASVLVLERAPEAWRGGNTKYTRNIRCAHDGIDGSPPYTEDELLDDLARVTGDELDQAMAVFTISESRAVPEWMEAQGVRWQPAFRGTLALGHTNRFFLGGGKALLNTYYRRAAALGVEVVYDAAVAAIEPLAEGVQLRVNFSDGSAERLRARALVVAAGGFEANLEWLARYWGEAAANFLVRGAQQNDGQVLRALIDLGAAERGNPRGFHAVACDARSPRFEGGIVTRVDAIPFGIVVNQEGRRFYDEGEDIWPKRYAAWGRLIAEQPAQTAFAVFDDRVWGRFIPVAYPPLVAGSLAELAAQLPVPAPALEATLAEYNRHVQERPVDHGRLDGVRTAPGLLPPKSNWALPIDRPPFRAYPLRPGITFTYLGVAVDRAARVLDAGGQPLRGVFAAGEIMAGNILRQGYLGGFGLTIGTVFGRIAGREAAAFARTA